LVNMVASTDGATVVDGVTAKLGSPGDKRVFALLRSLADVILVGAQTVRAERYGPPKLDDAGRQRRIARGQTPLPRIAVLTRSLNLDWSSRLFSDPTARPLVLAPESADPAALSAARAVSDVLVAGQGVVDLTFALGELSRSGVSTVLCEGGPTLNAQLAEQGLIDELCLTISPSLVGGATRPGIIGAAHLPEMIGLKLLHVLEEDGFLLLRYATAG
jgi:riboflavin biosynthesis pyrimidine reductase